MMNNDVLFLLVTISYQYNRILNLSLMLDIFYLMVTLKSITFISIDHYYSYLPICTIILLIQLFYKSI